MYVSPDPSEHWASIEAAAISGNLSESDSQEDVQGPVNRGPVTAITVAMVADPDMKERASPKAILHYEKPRIFHIPRVSGAYPTWLTAERSTEAHYCSSGGSAQQACL